MCFFYSIDTGLEDSNIRYVPRGLPWSYVSLVTFGHDTKIQMNHAKEYQDIRTLLGLSSINTAFMCTTIYGLYWVCHQ